MIMLVAVLALSGCSAFVAPDTTITTVTIGGSSVAFANALGHVVTRVPFSKKPETMLAAFTHALGKPSSHRSGEDEQWTWSDKLWLTDGFPPSNRGGSQLGVAAAKIRGVRIVAASHVGVGDAFPAAGATSTCFLGDDGLVSAPTSAGGPGRAVIFMSDHTLKPKIIQFQAPNFAEGC